jgi:hypothetical protein
MTPHRTLCQHERRQGSEFNLAPIFRPAKALWLHAAAMRSGLDGEVSSDGVMSRRSGRTKRCTFAWLDGKRRKTLRPVRAGTGEALSACAFVEER